MRIDEAMEEIDLIRQAASHAQTFDGFRALPTLGSAMLAVVAASTQSRWLSGGEAQAYLQQYVLLWSAVAVVSLGIVVIDMAIRYQGCPSLRQRRMTRQVLSVLTPSLCVGALLSACVIRVAPEYGWMLPSLWAFLLSLGVFALRPMLPLVATVGGCFYAAAATVWMLWSPQTLPIQPLAMGLIFGGGQCFAAGLLYWHLERLR